MKLDENFLREVGLLMMSEEKKEAFLRYVEEEIEVRVGEEISEGVSEEELAEFLAMETKEEAREWLKVHKPNFEEIIDKVVEEMKEEIRGNRERILK